jgi:cation transport protein ChaC
LVKVPADVSDKVRLFYDRGMPATRFPQLRPLPPLSAKERRQSLSRMLENAPHSGPIRVFAYGSLIWDPCFAYEAADKAMLDGYRRAFNFWSVLSRGTPERPGLGLGLAAGGRCHGVLFELAADTLDMDLEALWAREMYSAVYEPRWVRVALETGPCDAISFVTDTGHGQYTGDLAPAAAARIIMNAHGEKGSCRDYLASTVGALARYGIEDPDLTALLTLVEECRPD